MGIVTDKLPSPNWDILVAVVWRYARVFLAAFIGSFSVEKFVYGGKEIQQEILSAAIIAGISAVFKGIRDASADTSLVQKIPL